jgi:DNA-binding transcriptional LysR family regulator
MMLEARDLRLIDVVAEEGSLTRAGARLHATQPALSRHP